MDKIEKIRAEIERLKKYYAECGYPGMGEYEQGNKQGRMDTLDSLLSFLDTLSEEPDKGLEEEAEEFAEQEWDGLHDRDGNALYTEDYIQYTFIAGAEWQKQQMLKDAVECELVCIKDRLAVILPMKEFRWTVGDKVRILVLKAEEE